MPMIVKGVVVPRAVVAGLEGRFKGDLRVNMDIYEGRKRFKPSTQGVPSWKFENDLQSTVTIFKCVKITDSQFHNWTINLYGCNILKLVMQGFEG